MSPTSQLWLNQQALSPMRTSLRQDSSPHLPTGSPTPSHFIAQAGAMYCPLAKSFLPSAPLYLLPSAWIQTLENTLPQLTAFFASSGGWSLMPGALGVPWTTSTSRTPSSFWMRILPSASAANTAAICELQQLLEPEAPHSMPKACQSETPPAVFFAGSIRIWSSSAGHSLSTPAGALYFLTTPFHE